MQIRTQQYALAAYTRIQAVKNQAHVKEYGALALQFPVMVLQSGLAQASGFLLAKGKVHHLAYLNDLAEILGFGGDQKAKDLHRRIIASDLATCQRLTRNALDAAAWLKRYAQGELKADPTQTGENG